MKFFKLHDSVWINPDNIKALRVMDNEVWADDLLLTRYDSDWQAESDFDTLIEKINGEPTDIYGRDPHWRPSAAGFIKEEAVQ